MENKIFIRRTSDPQKRIARFSLIGSMIVASIIGYLIKADSLLLLIEVVDLKAPTGLLALIIFSLVFFATGAGAVLFIQWLMGRIDSIKDVLKSLKIYSLLFIPILIIAYGILLLPQSYLIILFIFISFLSLSMLEEVKSIIIQWNQIKTLFSFEK